MSKLLIVSLRHLIVMLAHTTGLIYSLRCLCMCVVWVARGGSVSLQPPLVHPPYTLEAQSAPALRLSEATSTR